MKKRVIWISLIGIVVVAGIVLIYIFNKPRNSVSDLPTDYTVEAPRLVEEFKADDEKANQKYLEKVIEVSGVIAEINISDNTSGSNCILRLTNEFSGVICEFEPGEDKELKNYQIGDNATIKGKYSGYLMDVVLNTCEIIE
ncbi:MAG: hypothetical protein WCR42_07960 [bacterium]